MAPVPPVMVTVGTMEKSNIITIGWTGIVNTIPPTTYISIKPERYSYQFVKDGGEFVINLTNKNLVFACDYCGVTSGAKIDKWNATNLTPIPGNKVSVPQIKQSPITLECKVIQIIPLQSHEIFLAEIVAVNVDENLIDKNGRLMIEKSELVAYAHGSYFEFGKKLGTFGYSVRKKSKRRKK